MLSRRHIRIKVFQALYEAGPEGKVELGTGLRKLQRSINRIYELYLFEVKVLLDIYSFAQSNIEQKRHRRLPSKEDLNPNLKFANNRFLSWLSENENVKAQVDLYKINWGDDKEILKNIFKEFQEGEEYNSYMSDEEDNLALDKKIVKVFYGKHIVHSETLHQLYEERDLHWADDLDAAQMMLAKTLKNFDENAGIHTGLPSLLKDESDMEFAKILFKECLLNADKYAEMIHVKAKNWEMDRIAFADILLMKMGIAELTNFKQIPVKVTLNEYIELGKEYSTPKSGNFINGILDKLKIELTESGDIKKIGRGLL